MGLFNFFGDSEHRVFNYKPIYYDRERDELKRKFGRVDGGAEKENEDGTYVPGAYLHGSMRDGAYRKAKSHLNKVQTIIGIVTLLLICAVLFFIAKFYALL